MKFPILIMSFLSFLTFGCSNAPSFKSVGVEEFARVAQDTSTVVVDVRSADEWNMGRLPQAQYNIDVLQEEFAVKAENTLPKEKTIAIYCRSGRRSKTAASKLAELGFQVVELDGGIISWQEKGMPITQQVDSI